MNDLLCLVNNMVRFGRRIFNFNFLSLSKFHSSYLYRRYLHKTATEPSVIPRVSAFIRLLGDSHYVLIIMTTHSPYQKKIHSVNMFYKKIAVI